MAYSNFIKLTMVNFRFYHNRPACQNRHPSSTEEREATKRDESRSASSSLVKEECHSDDKAVVFRWFLDVKGYII